MHRVFKWIFPFLDTQTPPWISQDNAILHVIEITSWKRHIPGRTFRRESSLGTCLMYQRKQTIMPRIEKFCAVSKSGIQCLYIIQPSAVFFLSGSTKLYCLTRFDGSFDQSRFQKTRAQRFKLVNLYSHWHGSEQQSTLLINSTNYLLL